MSVPAELKYTESHEWIRTEDDGSLTIGITEHAQEALGDIVFIELPVAGRTVAAGDTIAVIESVKAASDIYAPVSGEVVGANESLAGEPDRIQGNAYGAWLFKIKPDNPGATQSLMTADAYRKLIGE